MKKIIVILSCALILTAVASPAWSQGRGGGGQKASQGQHMGQGQMGQGQGQQGQGQQGQLDRQQQRIHLTTEQRQCFDASQGFADKARSQARGMAAHAGNTAWNPEIAVRERDALRDQVHNMLREHDRMAGGFADADQTRLGDRLRKLDRVRDRLDEHLRAMDRELERSAVDPQRFSNEARRLERDLEAWRKQFGKLGSELDLG